MRNEYRSPLAITLQKEWEEPYLVLVYVEKHEHIALNKARIEALREILNGAASWQQYKESQKDA